LEEARSIISIASDQVSYSMVNRDIENDVIPYCIKNEVGILAYSPMQRGLLTGKITPGYQFKGDDHRKDNPFFTIENRKKVLTLVEKLKPIAREHNATVAQVVINWTIHRQGITSALVGTRNVEQAEEKFKALDFTLTDEEVGQINKYADETKLNV
jgi:aryl-alcohol dehydrogenase-like predicted oxidoreductase